MNHDYGDMSYTLIRGTESFAADSRSDAVDMARRLSNERHQSVQVESEDGRVRMRYYDGQIMSYLHDLR